MVANPYNVHYYERYVNLAYALDGSGPLLRALQGEKPCVLTLISFLRWNVLTGSGAEPDTIRRKFAQAWLRRSRRSESAVAQAWMSFA
jgi:hypothetical protein